MRVVILTSGRRGTASHHLPFLVGDDRFTVVRVILAEGHTKPKGHWKRKLRKILRIGPLGAFIGYRMRRWYGADLQALAAIEDIGVVCARYGIELVSTPVVNHPTTVEALRGSDADIAISLGNGYIGSKVFGVPRLGMINIHHEILPAYQNAQGVIWQLYNNSTETGYTIHRIDKGIDTGAIIHQEWVPIQFKESLGATVSHTMKAVLDSSAQGLRTVLADLPAHLAQGRPQGAGAKWTTPSFWQFLRIRRNHAALRDRSTS
jgi:methionyl-tRNA formyltransferase